MHPGQYLHKPTPIRRIIQTQESKEQCNSKQNELVKDNFEIKKKICLNLQQEKNDLMENQNEYTRNGLSESSMNLWKCQQELQKELMISFYLCNILQSLSSQQNLNKQEQEAASHWSSWQSLTTILQEK